MEGPGWAGMERKLSDKARGGGAAWVAAGMCPETELVAEKGSAKGSMLRCCAGAALGPGALSWAKGSAACGSMQLHMTCTQSNQLLLLNPTRASRAYRLRPQQGSAFMSVAC